MRVIKRNGQIVPFDGTRIERAISSAFKDIKEEVEANMLAAIVGSVVQAVRGSDGGAVKVEAIQDLVEQQLMAYGCFQAAKHYVLYRSQHEKMRTDVEIDAASAEVIQRNREYLKTDLQVYQLISKYSQYNDALSRRETWEEVVDRSIDFLRWHMDSNYPAVITEDEWAEMRRSMLYLEAMPSMRLIQMAGPAAKRCNVCCYNCAYTAVDRLEAFPEAMYVLMQGTGMGFSVEGDYVERLPRIRRQKRKKVVHAYQVEDNTEGWCEALRFGLKTWYSGEDVKFDYSLVRPAGARLKTKGGRASGPGPLKSVLDFTRKSILSRQGLRLRPIDCHDIMCMIGSIVVVGGVRRAAEISLSDLNDKDMQAAKNGAFWEASPWRTMSNNSAVYNVKPIATDFMWEWLRLAESGSGERGIFNRSSMRKNLPKRRKLKRLGCNPCLHPNERIHTALGMIRAEDLYYADTPVHVLTDNRAACGSTGVSVRPATHVELTQRDVQVFDVELEHGHRIRCTGNHTFPTVGADKRCDELVAGDTLLLQSGEGCWGNVGSYNDGWLIGLVAGDGTVIRNKAGRPLVFIDVWENKFGILDTTLQAINDAVEAVPAINSRNYGPLKWTDQQVVVGGEEKKRTGGIRLGRYLHTQLGITTPEEIKDRIPECVWRGTREMVIGYLRGLYTTDGTVNVVGQGKKQTVSLRLNQNNAELLRQVQALLQNFGIVTRLYKRRDSSVRMLPDGKGGSAPYLCKDNWELIMNRPNAIRLLERVGLEGCKGEKLRKAIELRGTDCNKPERYISRVKSVTDAGRSDVYCLNEPETHSIVVNGVASRQCGEIFLRSDEFCNLSISVTRSGDTMEDLERKTRVAAMFGTIQSTLTRFSYLSDRWRKNCEEERLLGVDVTGIYDSELLKPGVPERRERLKHLRNYAVRVNEEIADRLGIPRSVAVTCNKPGGNSGVFLDCASTLRFSKYGVRRVRENVGPVAQLMIDAGVPHFPEYNDPNPDNPSTWVFEFPVKAPSTSVFKDDLDAVAQLENWRDLKECYTDHNPSVTIHVGPDEWLQAGNWVYDHWDIVGGLSFMPRSDHIYPLAPNEEITEEEYNRRVAEFPMIPWEKLSRYEKEDMTTSSQEFACTSGACELI